MFSDKPANNEVRNFYETKEMKEKTTKTRNPAFKETQINLPCRMLLVSQSGGGKTNCIMGFIEKWSKNKKGTFQHIHIVHKLDEDLYDVLAAKLKDKITFYKKLSDLPEAKDLTPTHSLVIFDDICAEKNQEKIDNYFLYGRKRDISSIYISQRYFAIPKIVRAQANYIILLKIRGEIDLRNILMDVSIGIPLKDFKRIYRDTTRDFPNFLKISTLERDDNKVLSKNYNGFIPIAHLIDEEERSEKKET